MPGLRVFDSWALLAWLLDQPAGTQVERLLEAAEQGVDHILMSWVNVGEVYYMASRKAGAVHAEEFLTRLPNLPIELLLPQEEDFIAAAKLKAAMRISYADAFAVGLAQREGASLVTGDPELKALSDFLSIHWIGPA